MIVSFIPLADIYGKPSCIFINNTRTGRWLQVEWQSTAGYIEKMYRNTRGIHCSEKDWRRSWSS